MIKLQNWLHFHQEDNLSKEGSMVAVLTQHKGCLSCTLFIIVMALQLSTGDANATCSNLPNIDNAAHRGNYTLPVPVNTVIRYYCNTGFEATRGMVTATCKLEEGSTRWVLSDSECKHKSCGHPGEVRNGRRIGDDFRFGQSVTYDCNSGYKLRGRNRLFCNANGEWTYNPPTCEAVSCGNPPELENGSVRFSSVTYQSIATYSCDNNFRFVGTTNSKITRQCMANETWSGTVPACEEVLCPAILPSPDITVTDLSNDKTRHPVGKLIYFTCKNGNTQTSECLDDGRWSNPPQCKEILCPHPDASPGIIISHPDTSPDDKHKEDDVIFYFCQSTGVRTVAKCKSDGTWTAYPGKCEAVTTVNATKPTLPPQSTTRQPDGVKRACGEAPPIEHGNVTYLQSHDATYKCEKGFTLKGPEVLTCLPSGKWDSKPPSCKKTLPIGLIVGIVVGGVVLIGVVIGAVVLFYKKRKSSVPGNKKKASPNDAMTMDEVQRLEKNNRPIPVTVL